MEGYGKLAVENDVLSREVESLMMLLHNPDVINSNYQEVDSEKIDKVHQQGVEYSPMVQGLNSDDVGSRKEMSSMVEDLQSKNMKLLNDISELKDIIERQGDMIQERDTGLKGYGEMSVENDMMSKEIEHLKKLIHEQQDQKANGLEVEKERKECARLTETNTDLQNSNERLNALVIKQGDEILGLRSDLNNALKNNSALQTNVF